MHGRDRNFTQLLTENFEERRTCGRPMHRCEGNATLNLQEMEWGGAD